MDFVKFENLQYQKSKKVGSFDLDENCTHIIYITYKIDYEFRADLHTAVFEKLRLEKKVKTILISNISEIYGPIILPKELDREVSKFYLYKEF